MHLFIYLFPSFSGWGRRKVSVTLTLGKWFLFIQCLHPSLRPDCAEAPVTKALRQPTEGATRRPLCRLAFLSAANASRNWQQVWRLSVRGGVKGRFARVSPSFREFFLRDKKSRRRGCDVTHESCRQAWHVARDRNRKSWHLKVNFFFSVSTTNLNRVVYAALSENI